MSTSPNQMVLAERRALAGLCRHCGGPVPCGSIHGDHTDGRKHTPETLAERASILRAWKNPEDLAC